MMSAAKELTVEIVNLNGKELIARRIARELRDGFYVNLGIGLPTMIAAYVPDGIEVTLQSENGLLGIGPPPSADQEDPDLINAGKQPVTIVPGSSFFGSDQAFAMIRGGHMNMSILGAMQVSCRGDLANLDHPRQDGERHGRRYGFGRQRRSRDCGDGAQRERRSPKDCGGMLTAADGAGRGG